MHRYAERAGRSECDVQDLMNAFEYDMVRVLFLFFGLRGGVLPTRCPAHMSHMRAAGDNRGLSGQPASQNSPVPPFASRK